MNTSKQLRLEQKIALEQRQVIAELQTMAGDIERCEQTIGLLRAELESINGKHAARQTTQQDIDYLEDLLRCAKKKLQWEKRMASLHKRTPELMQRVESLVNHPLSRPDEQTRTALLQSLQNVKAAMERLQGARL